MALQRINVGYGGLRIDGNLQVVTNTANVYLGNITYPLGSVFASNITTTSAAGIVPSANVTQNLGSSTAYWGTVFAGQHTGNTAVLNAGTGNAVVATGNVYVAGSLIPFTANATYNLGTTNSWWNTFYGVSTQAKYADVAENYLADSDYTPGTVLVFGGSQEVTASHSPYDTAVAGVVSTNPAHIMNNGIDGVAVALIGRVPCQVLGPVSKGELLVTSHIPGVAQRLEESNWRPGCVIGKALETVNVNETATIEVVVGRI
jgi:hypothetical protein